MSSEEGYVGAALATTIAAKAAPTVEFSPDKTRLTEYQSEVIKCASYFVHVT